MVGAWLMAQISNFSYPNAETFGVGQRGSDIRGWTVHVLQSVCMRT